MDVVALLDRLRIRRCKAIGMSFGGNTLLHVECRGMGGTTKTARARRRTDPFAPRAAVRAQGQLRRDEPHAGRKRGDRTRGALTRGAIGPRSEAGGPDTACGF